MGCRKGYEKKITILTNISLYLGNDARYDHYNEDEWELVCKLYISRFRITVSVSRSTVITKFIVMQAVSATELLVSFCANVFGDRL